MTEEIKQGRIEIHARNEQRVNKILTGMRRARPVHIGLPGDRLTAIGRLREERRKERFHQLAMIDDLTDLYSRRYFERELNQELKEKFRVKGKSELGLIIADLRALKLFNDNYGHNAGDLALIEVGKALKNEAKLRQSDSACRKSGDEFGIICPEVDGKNSKDGIVTVALRILEAVNLHTINPAGTPLSLQLDLGVTLATDNDDSESIQKRADRASYLAKRLFQPGERKIVIASIDDSGREIFESAQMSLDAETKIIQYTPIDNAAELLKSMV